MIDEYLNKIINDDTLESVKKFPDATIDCIITSPPYYQLRDYGFTGQWGLEKTYQEYLDKLISLMVELKRVLKPTGTMWINLGDSYGTISGGIRGLERAKKNGGTISKKNIIGQGFEQQKDGAISKCLMLIPHRFAIRCIDELGLILRNDVIWAKRNGMPESVTDRFSKKHEFFFFFVKQQKYYFDLDGVRDKMTESTAIRYKSGWNGNKDRDWINSAHNNFDKFMGSQKALDSLEKGKNPGDVSDFWDIPTQPSSEKHYATYNFDLIDKPIVAGCPKGGIILDPFCGTGTTLARAIQLHRNGIGIDGSEEYCKIAQKKIEDELAQQDLFRETA